jgi:hypothetical protein
MLAEIGGAIEFLGRFVTFWGFILKPTFRRAVMEEWKQDTRLARFLGLVDGIVTTAVGLLPFALLGAGVWLLA